MKLSIKIFLIAILYQTVYFICMLYGYTWYPKILFSLIPIEFIGGLPGLLLFSVIVRYLIRSHSSIRLKWLYIISGAYLSAFLTNLVTSWFLAIPNFRVSIAWQYFLQPAPIAAIFSTLTLMKPVHRLLKENAGKTN